MAPPSQTTGSDPLSALASLPSVASLVLVVPRRNELTSSSLLALQGFYKFIKFMQVRLPSTTAASLFADPPVVATDLSSHHSFLLHSTKPSTPIKTPPTSLCFLPLLELELPLANWRWARDPSTRNVSLASRSTSLFFLQRSHQIDCCSFFCSWTRLQGV